MCVRLGGPGACDGPWVTGSLTVVVADLHVQRQREKEEREDDEGDEEESDDEEDDEEEEENEEPGEGQKGEGKGSKKTSRAMALCEEINALLLKAGIKDPARTSK